jgi:glycosyltransferase involved in cell wall biosynthesis
MSPVITVATVVKDAASDLRRTHRSLASQAFGDWEWVVVDGASTDGSAQVARELRSPSAVLLSEPDSGIYDAMNKATDMAHGDYIVYLNAGDELFGNRVLASLAEILTKRNRPDLVCTGAVIQFPNRLRCYRAPREVTSLADGLPCNHQAAYFRTDVAKQVRYDRAYRNAGDFEFFVRLWERGPRVSYWNTPTALFRVGGVSTKRFAENIREACRAYRLSMRRSRVDTGLFSLRALRGVVLMRLLMAWDQWLPMSVPPRPLGLPLVEP